jgi:hypothetical protein
MDEGTWPFDRKIAFAIRDDDVSYFTQPWMIDRLYQKAWQLGFRVSLAVIPNIKSIKSNAPRTIRNSNRYFPISENKELVDYLMEKIAHDHVDIVQHGYTHSRTDGKPEFAIRNFELINDRLKKGNKLLRETFKQDVTVFVAPHDKISSEAWKSIVQNNMCLCRRFTLGRFLLTVPILNIDFSKLVKAIFRSPNPSKLVPNSIIDLADTFVIQWCQLFSSNAAPETQLESAKQQFLERLTEGGAFVTMHHHWDYFYDRESRKMRQDLLTSFNDFLNFVSSANGVWKTTLSEICSQIKTQRLNIN